MISTDFHDHGRKGKQLGVGTSNIVYFYKRDLHGEKDAI